MCGKGGTSSPQKGVYNPKTFILHVALLDQAFAHCPKFLTAASRRSGDRVSVPLWLVILLDQLPVIALVSHYLTNKLISQRLTPHRFSSTLKPLSRKEFHSPGTIEN